MKKHIHLAFCCLLSSMLFQAHAMQQNDLTVGQDAGREMAELSALTHDDDAAETRSLCGSRKCGKANCGKKDSCCEPKNNCCTKLQCRQMIATLDIVESKVCLLTECTPIPISAPTTIMNPGLYCLTNDITGDITVNANDVTIDMNCHQLTGNLTISAGNENVSVFNGIIDQEDTGAECVTISMGANNIDLSELTLKNATGNGLAVTNAMNIFISNLLIEECQNGCELLSSCTNVFVTDTVFDNNNSIGFNNNDAIDVVLTNCHAINNGDTGFSAGTGERVYFFNCIAIANMATGFVGSSAGTCKAVECVADNNVVNGFFTNIGTAYFERCLAKNNGGDGFTGGSATDGTVNQCVALNNTGNGFADGVSAIQYISNYAQDNTNANYDPAVGSPFNPFLTTDAGITYWYNTEPA